MRRCRNLALLLICCVLGDLGSLGQSIRVCVMNTDTGKPLAGKEVHVESAPQTSSAAPGSSSVLRVHPKLKLKTDHAGWTGFELNQLGNPQPDRLLVSVAGGNWTQCSPLYITLDDVLRSGVLAKNNCKSDLTSDRAYTVKPGELIVFTRHISVGEKIKHFPQ